MGRWVRAVIPLNLTQPAEEALRRIANLMALNARRDVEIRQVVLGCAASMEAYVDTSVENMIRSSGVLTTTPGPALVDELRPDFARTWNRRHYWFRVLTGDGFAGDPHGQSASVVVDLRNALAHGTGGLSPMQVAEGDGGFGLTQRFERQLSVELIGGVLSLQPRTARQATEIARAFLLRLDLSVAAAHVRFGTGLGL